MSGRRKRCSNHACRTKTGRRRTFSADKAWCPQCGSPPEESASRHIVAKGSAKGGGKSAGSKRIMVASTGGTRVARKRRPPKKIRLAKWYDPMKDSFFKPKPSKDVGRKRS